MNFKLNFKNIPSDVSLELDILLIPTTAITTRRRTWWCSKKEKNRREYDEKEQEDKLWCKFAAQFYIKTGDFDIYSIESKVIPSIPVEKLTTTGSKMGMSKLVERFVFAFFLRSNWIGAEIKIFSPWLAGLVALRKDTLARLCKNDLCVCKSVSKTSEKTCVQNQCRSRFYTVHRVHQQNRS